MEILPSAHNVVIHNSQFTEQTIQVKNNISTSSSGIDVLLQASSPGAFHDSIIRDPQPRCFPGTREQYIEDITQWAAHERPSDSEPDWPVYWMRGPAGVGKTAIAQTCAEKLKEQGYLGAAFFFSIHGRDDYTRLFPSIAYQLSTELPDYRQLLDSRISNDKTLVAKDMERQFQSLISGPLKELQESGKDVGKRAILIDGLDECRSRDMQCKIVEIIAASIQDLHFPLRWAFLSRPDEHIEATFKSKNIKSLCLLKELKISRAYDNEIELYLRSSFQDILQRRIHCTQSPWPSDEAIKRLVEACAGLFLYAETLLRYIRLAGSLGPVKQLNQVLEAISGTSTPGATSSSPFEELDAFYALILRRIHKDILPNVQKLLGFMFIYSFHATLFWGAVNLSNQLRFSNDEFLTVFSELRAILCFHEYNELVADESYPGSIVSLARLRHAPSSENYAQVRQEAHFLGGVITLYHKSFWDFLRDPRYMIVYSSTMSSFGVTVKRTMLYKTQILSLWFWWINPNSNSPGLKKIHSLRHTVMLDVSSLQERYRVVYPFVIPQKFPCCGLWRNSITASIYFAKRVLSRPGWPFLCMVSPTTVTLSFDVSTIPCSARFDLRTSKNSTSAISCGW